MIFIIATLLIITTITVILITKLNKYLKTGNNDVFGSGLGNLRKALKDYFTYFLDTNNPPTNPYTGEKPDPVAYRDFLSKGAYPSDTIAYAQVKLYDTWDLKTRLAWDNWLFVNLETLYPYIKGMVDDYCHGTVTMTDGQIYKINEEIAEPLKKQVKSMFDQDIDLTNVYDILTASNAFKASQDKMN